MTKKLFIDNLVVAILVCTSVVLLAQAIHISDQVIYAVDQLDRYWMVLTGDQVVPPVDTEAIGFVGLKFQDDTTRLLYNINLDKITNVTGIYLYYRNADHNNRTRVLDFMNETKESNKGFTEVLEITEAGGVKGTISYGGVTQKDLGGPLKGKSLSNLRDLMTNGVMYVSVHTRTYPEGELGGHAFIPIDRVFPDLNEFKWG